MNDSIFLYNPHSQDITKLSKKTGAYALVYSDSLIWSTFFAGEAPGFKINLNTGEETLFSS